MIKQGLCPGAVNTTAERKVIALQEGLKPGDNIIFVTGLSVKEITYVPEISFDFSCPGMADIDNSFVTMAADVQKDGIACEVAVNNG